MIEKVNPSHPDKIADRIAGAIVDLAYKQQDNPKIAVEVLIGHGKCHIITETSTSIDKNHIEDAVSRIASPLIEVDYQEVPQDAHLAANQEKMLRCGDNGIFKGVPTNPEEYALGNVVRRIYAKQSTDGKYIWDKKSRAFIACQSCTNDSIRGYIDGVARDDLEATSITINPLGDWTGGVDVDSGATNRKLGSDMGRAVTGGGLHGKDLSKADVSVNIVCHILAKECQQEVEALCAIGDEEITFERTDGAVIKFDYVNVVETARKYIQDCGGFEKFAEWGLI